MDYQSFVDGIAMPCCVLSVEKTERGTCGLIRVVCANEPYKRNSGRDYRAGMTYDSLVPQNDLFEEHCFDAAFGNKLVHNYVEIRSMHTWVDYVLVPLASDHKDVGYCQFMLESMEKADIRRMGSVSTNIAEEIIISCISLMGAENFHDSVKFVLADILDVSDGETSRIILLNDDRKTTEVFAEFSRLQKGMDRSIPDYALIKTWEATLDESNLLRVLDERDMRMLAKKNPSWVKSLRDAHIDNLIISPLRRQDSVFGYMYVVNFNAAKAAQTCEYVELMSFFLSSEISNNMLMDKLNRISKIDALTGLNNRRAMIQKINEINGDAKHSEYGVISLDLNGLKHVNDNIGHDAGDVLLIKAAEFLKQFFRASDLYRMGGDEFVVIATGMEHAMFKERVCRMRSRMIGNTEVNFAIGEFWCDGTVDTNSAFRYADTKMYEDKRAYYEAHPELKRK